MSTGAIHKKMIDEFLEKIKDWPDDAKRSLVEKIDRMLKLKKKPQKKKLGTLDAFGAWQGPETADEIIEMIRSSRTINRERESFD